MWVLEAGSLNWVSNGDDYIYVPGGEYTNRYLPGNLSCAAPETELPIALLPNRTNVRIVAQQGMFTLHGHRTDGIEQLAIRHADLRLGRIVLDRSSIPHFLQELDLLGVSQHSVYPDADAVARHVVWVYQSTKQL